MGQHVFQKKKSLFYEVGKLKGEEEVKQRLLVRIGEGVVSLMF